jgi:stage II sporulation protein M
MISINSNWFKYFSGVYERNKFILAVAAVIFFLSLFIGILVGYLLPDFTLKIINVFVQSLLSYHIEKTTLSIFAHNLQAVLLEYSGGVIGIIPIIALLTNGFIIGAFFGYLFNHSYLTAIGSLSVQKFLVFTLPHGIFEIPGFIIAGAAGLRVTTRIIDLIKKIIYKKPEPVDNWKLKDSLFLLVISIILIFIAAIIEANITPVLGSMFGG